MAPGVSFPTPLVEGVFLRRYKRFFADVELPGGQVVVAHCANTGSMRGVGLPGSRCRVLDVADPSRKLGWSLEQLEVDGHWVMVNTARPNRVVEAAILAGALESLRGYDTLLREQRYGSRNSRIDLLLLDGGELLPGESARVVKRRELRPARRAAYVEVKSVTLVEGGVARFPDSVSTRGARHLAELADVVAAGHRGVLVFLVGRADGAWVEPADDLDPAYGVAIRSAAAAGVELMAVRCDVRADGLGVLGPVEVRLP